MSRYRKEYRIGAGGMGEVFRVTRVLHDGEAGPAACKVMRGQLAMDAKCVRLFHREAKLGLAVGNDDPNVVSVYEYLASSAPDGERTFYLIMELVEGVDLGELVRHRERLSFDMLRCIARDMLSGLRYLHKRGVLHRDLSPSNVLVSVAGVAKLADFGVAKFVTTDGLQSQSIHGKPAYVAPELCVGRPIDGRADLFAFAATLYHLLAGVAPLGSTMPEMIERRAEWQIDDLPADVPADLRDVVTGLLRQAPDERDPQTTDDALAMIAEPCERDAVADGLGAIVSELYARKLKRWHRYQSQRAKLAESEEYIEAEAMLEGFADAVHRADEAASADVERHETELVSASSWRFMEPNVGEEAAGAEAAQAEEANGAQVTANRPRLALTMMLAVAAIIALAIGGDVRLDGDPSPPIGWQLVRPHSPGDEWMPAHGEEPAEQSAPAPAEEPTAEELTPAPDSEPTAEPTEERPAEETTPALDVELTAEPAEERPGEPTPAPDLESTSATAAKAAGVRGAGRTAVIFSTPRQTSAGGSLLHPDECPAARAKPATDSALF